MDVKVWVGCLAHYNNGALIGAWVDASEAPSWTCPQANPDDVYVNCEETWIFDHEIPGLSGECSPADAARIAEVLADLYESEVKPFRLWRAQVDSGSGISDDAVDRFRDAYCGQYDSFRDFAVDDFEEHWGDLVYRETIDYPHCYRPQRRVPEEIANLINLDAYADNLEQSYTYADGYVFRDE